MDYFLLSATTEESDASAFRHILDRIWATNAAAKECVRLNQERVDLVSDVRMGIL